jgi:hypothetical protein
MRVLLLLLFL